MRDHDHEHSLNEHNRHVGIHVENVPMEYGSNKMNHSWSIRGSVQRQELVHGCRGYYEPMG